jgi:hypothetical protein
MKLFVIVAMVLKSLSADSSTDSAIYGCAAYILFFIK